MKAAGLVVRTGSMHGRLRVVLVWCGRVVMKGQRGLAVGTGNWDGQCGLTMGMDNGDTAYLHIQGMRAVRVWGLCHLRLAVGELDRLQRQQFGGVNGSPIAKAEVLA